MHVATGATAYSAPVAFGLAWWVPFLFGAAAVAMGLARPLAERMTGAMTAPPTRRLGGAPELHGRADDGRAERMPGRVLNLLLLG